MKEKDNRESTEPLAGQKQRRSGVRNAFAVDINDLSPLSLKSGIILRNRYLLDESLGSGGMGEVFKAFDSEENRVVAIKRMRVSHDPVARRRFRREYKFLELVNHPNLIKAYEYFEYRNDLFMVLEYVEGESMKQILNIGKKNFTLSEQLAIANKVARAIEVMNTGGIIHRDIKPANIMINRKTGDVKILDLGLGKNILEVHDTRQLTQQGMLIGTLAYMSPEQANGKLSIKSDVFSLGITLYQFFLWHKHSPFFDNEPFNIILKIADFNPPTIYEYIQQRLAKTGRTLSARKHRTFKAISEVVARALTKDSHRRWNSTRLMAEQFATIQQRYIASKQEEKEEPDNVRLADISKDIDPGLRDLLGRIRQETEQEEMLKKSSIYFKESYSPPLKNKSWQMVLAISLMIFSLSVLATVIFFFNRRQPDNPLANTIRDLRHGNAQTREQAAIALYKHGKKSETAVLALIRALEDTQGKVAEYAAQTLVTIGERSAAPLFEFLKTRRLNKRILALLLKHPHPQVRERAQFNLESFGPEALAEFISLLEQPSASLRSYARCQILSFGWPIQKKLLTALATGKINKREAAALVMQLEIPPVPEAMALLQHHALALLQEQQGRYLLRFLAHPTLSVRQAALLKLEALGPQAQVRVSDLQSALQNRDLRQAAIRTAIWIDPQSIASLFAILEQQQEIDFKKYAIEQLVWALDGSNLTVATAAEKQLLVLADQAVKILIDALEENAISGRAKIKIVAIISQIGHAKTLLPLLINAINGPAAGYVAQLIIEIGEPSVPFLLTALRNENSKAQAIAILVAMKGKAIAQILKSLDDNNWETRIAAVTGLAATAKIIEQPQLQQEVVGRLAKCLVDSTEKKHTEQGQSAQKRQEVRLAQAAQKALLAIGANAVAVLVDNLRDHNISVRRYAALALGIFGKQSGPGVVRLIEMVNNNSEFWKVRQAAVQALGDIVSDSPRVIKALVKALQDPASGVRSEAARSLAKIGSPAIADLLTALTHRDDRMREMAARSLGLIGKKACQAVPALVLITNDRYHNVRNEAVQALGKIGCQEQQVLEALAQAKKDRDPQVRQSAREALEKLAK